MQPLLTRSRDIDLNILLFPDFVIIVHQGHHWSGFKDMLGFLNLLCSYGNSSLTPDWILFSIFIELNQDAKYCVKSLEPKILNLKVADSIMENGGENLDKDALATELSNVLTKNFENEFEIYKINGFIKPKIKVLKLLRPKCGNRIGSGVLNLLSGTRKEFEELGEALDHFSHILERSQDTCLTMANVRQSQESNQMGKAMKRISEVALLFLPLQALAGFLGMNVRVPFQQVDSTAPFWGIILSCSVLLVGLYRVSKSASKVRVVKKATSVGFKK
ncbi:Manganese resistance protein MNR2 [Folsomia candida]|uniref:Manganese resistance protein MNR2 n=2 Tax=Folsomia candida TaxID=158441 RepID=A0A226E3W5_FOLCA|nr:Manganese resistance protein MNR2 [Folsomia candida]